MVALPASADNQTALVNQHMENTASRTHQPPADADSLNANAFTADPKAAPIPANAPGASQKEWTSHLHEARPNRIEARGGPEGDYFDKLNWVRERQGHIEQIITKYPSEYVIVVGWHNPTPKTDYTPQP